jgi:glycosyltransferase involved in cell wall biosynthesis
MNNKSVCLNMIVKNESAVIRRCLESVKKAIDYWVIVDTGSSDGTQDVIRETLKDVPGDLYERKWVDFGTNRNEALQFAKGKADYLLLIDADERLIFRDPCLFPPLEKDIYASIYRDSSQCMTQRILLINQHLNWKWSGVIHEMLECSDAKSFELLENVVNFAPVEGSRSKHLPNKFRTEIEILQNALKDNPLNSRFVFHLALNYEALDEFNLALKWFAKRSQMDPLNLEVYYSHYRIGLIHKHLHMSADLYVDSFLQAFQSAPRAEPLFWIAKYFMQSQCYLIGYLISELALSIEINRSDFFFIDVAVYEYRILYQYAECAFRIQKYREAYGAFQGLLTIPSLPTKMRESAEQMIELSVFNGYRKR